MCISVENLIEKLQTMPPKEKVYLQDAGDPIMGSELTGCMGCGIAGAEDVRKIEQGVMITIV